MVAGNIILGINQNRIGIKGLFRDEWPGYRDEMLYFIK